MNTPTDNAPLWTVLLDGQPINLLSKESILIIANNPVPAHHWPANCTFLSPDGVPHRVEPDRELGVGDILQIGDEKQERYHSNSDLTKIRLLFVEPVHENDAWLFRRPAHLVPIQQKGGETCATFASACQETAASNPDALSTTLPNVASNAEASSDPKSSAHPADAAEPEMAVKRTGECCPVCGSVSWYKVFNILCCVSCSHATCATPSAEPEYLPVDAKDVREGDEWSRGLVWTKVSVRDIELIRDGSYDHSVQFRRRVTPAPATTTPLTDALAAKVAALSRSQRMRSYRKLCLQLETALREQTARADAAEKALAQWRDAFGSRSVSPGAAKEFILDQNKQLLTRATTAEAQVAGLREDKERLMAGIEIALRYPRGSESQVRCLEEVGGDVKYMREQLATLSPVAPAKE
jgi:hypothetical protein